MTDAPPERRLGKIRITGVLLDTLISKAISSKAQVIGLDEYDVANDTWVFVCRGPDFPEHFEGGDAPFVGGEELRRIREFRETQDG